MTWFLLDALMDGLMFVVVATGVYFAIDMALYVFKPVGRPKNDNARID